MRELSSNELNKVTGGWGGGRYNYGRRYNVTTHPPNKTRKHLTGFWDIK